MTPVLVLTGEFNHQQKRFSADLNRKNFEIKQHEWHQFNIIIRAMSKLIVLKPSCLHFQADDPCCNTRAGLDRRRRRQAETCSSWRRSPHCRADESALASCPTKVVGVSSIDLTTSPIVHWACILYDHIRTIALRLFILSSWYCAARSS